MPADINHLNTDVEPYATCTVVTAKSPKRLSKAFSVRQDGSLMKSAGGVLSAGRIEIRLVKSHADLSEILQGLDHRQALIYGVAKNGADAILSRDLFVANASPAQAATRTKEYFQWPLGGGVMMIDYDPSRDAALSRHDLVDLIRQAAPGLRDAAMTWFPSASSCIFNGNEELAGIKGQRLYILVQEASDIPRAGRVLHDRLWLIGQGKYVVSKSGALLDRSIVDCSVWQPSRLDFAGGSFCAPPLHQDRGLPQRIDGENEFIDSRSIIPDLTQDELRTLASMRVSAKTELAIEAQVTRDAWIDARIGQALGASDDNNVQREMLRAELVRSLEDATLSGSFLLDVEVDGAVLQLTVSEILTDRNKYDGCLTRDPIEPEYDNSRLVGKLYLHSPRPRLFSFAHGGKTYRLQQTKTSREVLSGHTAEVVDYCIEMLRVDPIAFDFGGQLALVDDGTLYPLNEHGLSHHISSSIQFWRWRLLKQGAVKADCDPTPNMLKQILALGERRKLKPLEGIITAPTLRLDGSLLTSGGYDERTRLYLDPRDHNTFEIPENPDRDEMIDALSTVMHPFMDFPFVDALARSALLAAVLTAAVRPVLPTSPAFAFDAPIQGSGKTLLAACVGALRDGRRPDVWPHTGGRDDEEVRKRILTVLRMGTGAIIWDNVDGVFNSAAMAAFLTAPIFIDRILGKSEASRIPNRALLLITGNNLMLSGDMPRRVITCRIDPGVSEPYARQFQLDPLAHCLEHRHQILSSALTLIRGQLNSGTCSADGRLASFEDWDRLVRQTVCYIATHLDSDWFADPIDLIRLSQVSDPDQVAHAELLTALHVKFGSERFFAKDLLDATTECHQLQAALDAVSSGTVTLSAQSIGKILRKREGRIANNIRLTGSHDYRAGMRCYRVEGVTGLPEGSA
jgi:hypothetical protein